jgi:uncharacterized protein YlxW (UPF0749 family)
MKRILIALILSAVTLTISFSRAQSPNGNANQEQQLLALIKEVQAQQAQMAENQAKIEEKLNEVEQAVRDARIFSKRSK